MLIIWEEKISRLVASKCASPFMRGHEQVYVECRFDLRLPQHSTPAKEMWPSRIVRLGVAHTKLHCRRCKSILIAVCQEPNSDGTAASSNAFQRRTLHTGGGQLQQRYTALANEGIICVMAIIDSLEEGKTASRSTRNFVSTSAAGWSSTAFLLVKTRCQKAIIRPWLIHDPT